MNRVACLAVDGRLEAIERTGLAGDQRVGGGLHAFVFSVQLAKSPLEGLFSASSLVREAIFLKSASLPCPLAMRALRDSLPLKPSSMICSTDIEGLAADVAVEVQPDTTAISAAASTAWERVRRFTGVSDMKLGWKPKTAPEFKEEMAENPLRPPRPRPPG